MHRLNRLVAGIVGGALVAAGIHVMLATGPGAVHRERGDERGDAGDALLALDFWTQSRAYPAPDIPPDRFLREVERARAVIPELDRGPSTGPPGGGGPAGAATTGWRNIGPANFCGRMISVAVDPSNPGRVYAGAASGGLWRSNTGGLGGDWVRIATGYPVLGVNAIAVDPTASNTIYIGTGEVYRYQSSVGGLVGRTTRGSYGLGILKSTDGGATWTRSLDWSEQQQRGVQAIRVNPRNPATLFAATTEGVYRSRDHGGTWSLVLPVTMARDVAINAADTTQVLASCGDFASPGTGIYRSTDGGTSFNAVGGLPAFSGYARLEPYARHPSTVYASLADSTSGNGGLYRSTDFGATWSLVNGEAIYQVQGWYSHFVAVNPADSARVIRGAVSLFRSTDGGVTQVENTVDTWADHHDYAHDPVNPDILYVADDGGVWRTDDFGLTWPFAAGGIVTAQFYNGFSNSAQDSLLALGQVQDHFGFQYQGSPAWAEGGVDEVGWTAINAQNDSIMYADSRSGGRVYRSVDRGVTYTGLPVGAGFGPTCWNTPFILSPSDPSVLYFGWIKVFKSVDAGLHWTATAGGLTLDGNPALSMAMSATNPDTVFVGTAPVVTRAHWFRSVNGGASWTDVTGTLPDRYPLDLAVDPGHSNIVYAVTGGFGTGHVFKSTNTGASWTDITGTLPDVPATAVFVDPLHPRDVYVGNDAGVYLSNDGGTTWYAFNSGFPEAVLIADLCMTPANRTLRVATHGSGVFERALFEPSETSVAGAGGSGGAGGAAGSGNGAIVALRQNSPNPARAGTTIAYEVAAAGPVRLVLYDAMGREVETLVDRAGAAGERSVSIDASRLAPGVYYYTLRAGGRSETRKMVVAR